MIYEQQEIFYTWSSKDENTVSVHIINVVTNPIIEKNGWTI